MLRAERKPPKIEQSGKPGKPQTPSYEAEIVGAPEPETEEAREARVDLWAWNIEFFSKREREAEQAKKAAQSEQDRPGQEKVA